MLKYLLQRILIQTAWWDYYRALQGAEVQGTASLQPSMDTCQKQVSPVLQGMKECGVHTRNLDSNSTQCLQTTLQPVFLGVLETVFLQPQQEAVPVKIYTLGF